MAERRLHIGIDGRELVGRPTGVGRYLRHVLTEWTRERTGHRVTVFLPAEPPDELVQALPGISWHVTAGTTGGTIWEQTRFPAALARAKADVLFAGGYTAPLRRVCPFVVVIHDVSFFAHPEWFPPRERFRRRLLTRLAARHAHSVITVSEFSAGEIVRWLGVPRDKIYVTPHGPPDVASVAAADERRPVVLFVGSLFNRRHIPELIRGFALASRSVPGARLVLVGDNRTYPPIDPLAIAAAAGTSDVEWRQYVPEAELRALYGCARVFAFISEYEGYAMTPMEAIRHGVPVVLQDTAVAREVYGDAARMVPPMDDAIAHALVELLSDDNAHRELVVAGARRLAGLSWPRTAEVALTALERAADAR